MICPRCLHRLTPSSRLPLPLRPLSTTARLLTPPSTAPDHTTQTTPRGPPHSTHEGPPAATSTSTAQPFSTPLTPSPQAAASSTTPAEAALPRSSVPAGTVLRGLGYVKGKDAPVAKEDSEYPDWLWGLLSEKRGPKSAEGEEGAEEGNLYSKSKNQRRLASKRAAALAAAGPSDPSLRKVPLEQQSIDLPRGDGTVAGAVAAGEAREQVRTAMRRGRRMGIKESNFLKRM